MKYILTVGWILAGILPTAPGILSNAKADDQTATPAKQSSAAATSKPRPSAKVYVEITAEWPGASVEEIEVGLAIPIEQAVSSLPELRTVRTRILNSTCRLTLTFVNRADAKKRLAEIDSVLRKLRELPEGTNDIQIRMQPPLQSSPLWVVWKPAADNRALTSTQMRRMRKLIAQLPNVGQVRAYGIEQPYLEVIVDEAALRRWGMSYREAEELVDRWNLRFGGKRDPSVRELENLPLKITDTSVGFA